MISVKNLNTVFRVASKKFFGKDELKAVENVCLEIVKGRTVGLVGESGCGKSTLGRTILQLQRANSGSVQFEGSELTSLSESQLRPFRKKMQVIFQDPFSSLNPRMTIREIISEGLLVHENLSRTQSMLRVAEILNKVGLEENILERYPHEFSGGQRQRIAIGRALILRPEFVVCDEAVSALDVSTQAQVVNLLIGLREEIKLSYLFISHDLSIIKYISDDIAVMYLGKLVEFGSKDKVVENPKHPYTKALFASVFDISDRKKERIVISGEIPSIMNKPKGCYFHTRCPVAKDICREKEPEYVEKETGHWASCHFA
ncbi:MAG: ATP-binding cassette domain-containing protein [Leptospira sp.]|nr:ATP-binding cassette domain-containing protein [Leptospira sp.]